MYASVNTRLRLGRALFGHLRIGLFDLEALEGEVQCATRWDAPARTVSAQTLNEDK